MSSMEVEIAPIEEKPSTIEVEVVVVDLVGSSFLFYLFLSR